MIGDLIRRNVETRATTIELPARSITSQTLFGPMSVTRDTLLSDVASATRRRLGDRWAWKRTSDESPITPLVAASLALWGAISVAPKPTPQVF